MNVLKIWNTLFLEERPSIGLSFFRIFVALTVGFHVIPTFFHLDDNFLSTAFRIANTNFFTIDILNFVGNSPDWLVIAFVGLFLVTWFCFLIGLFSQVSCILLTLCCYYFYALNCFHIGTLSWDILLVTLFLMCITPYHGDYFSIDAVRRNDPDAWQLKRSFFIQRLLQLQLASTFFYTGLHKITAQGNWITGNPIYALMNYPPVGVTKFFLLKEWLGTHPHLCYAIGILIVAVELTMPIWLFWPKTRRSAILAGFFFHVLLILTLDVPTIFFFLFPAQMLLFIHPQRIVEWIARRRAQSYKLKVQYDGNCGICKASVDQLKVMDLWGHLTFEPIYTPLSEVKLVDGDKVYGGFEAFRRMCLILPMMYPLLLIFYFPGASVIGPYVYRYIATHRYLLKKLS